MSFLQDYSRCCHPEGGLMLDSSNEPANTVTHPTIAKQPAQQALRAQQRGRTKLLTSTFRSALNRPERVL
tara:strand:- start:515 stop:724 length:210 start_codon:yes stop_codon:yes gene_type:complete